MFRKIIVLLSISLAGGSLSGGASAQTPPSAAQIKQYTGIHQAAYANDVVEIGRLAKTGADINARDSYRRTPAHVAAFASNDKALAALADAGADLNALEAGLYDVVTIAAVANDPELMSLAIRRGNRADLTTSIYDGTALIAAAHLGHQEIVQRLIDAGAPLDHVNNLGWTALIEAVILGDGGPDHLATVKALVAAGADRSIADRNGVTPLAHAENRNYQDIAAIIRNGSQ
uniref:ankyrin repeat domain-containing protein n=1 Tax=Pararhizobium sp. IMCC3301 TaxID=3067904 RepID=UPI002741990B|nr:ankyrin repeat domain-containing protein [Pararhizobium sp. IMCC3301]